MTDMGVEEPAGRSETDRVTDNSQETKSDTVSFVTRNNLSSISACSFKPVATCLMHLQSSLERCGCGVPRDFSGFFPSVEKGEGPSGSAPCRHFLDLTGPSFENLIKNAEGGGGVLKGCHPVLDCFGRVTARPYPDPWMFIIVLEYLPNTTG